MAQRSSRASHSAAALGGGAHFGGPDPKNEDFAAAFCDERGRDVAFVIDGAHRWQNSVCEHDTIWHSSRLARYLEWVAVANRGNDVRDVMAAGIYATEMEHRIRCAAVRKLDDRQLDLVSPVAKVVIARREFIDDEQNVEIAILGDVAAAITHQGEILGEFTDNRYELLAGRAKDATSGPLAELGEAIRAYNNTRVTNPTERQLRQAIFNEVQQQYQNNLNDLENTFWVAAATPDAADHAVYINQTVPANAEIGLISDGIDPRLFATSYHRSDGWIQICTIGARYGPDAVIEEARKRRRPSTNPGDDKPFPDMSAAFLVGRPTRVT